MTTLSFNQANTFNTARSPRTSFAARLARLQARHEQTTDYAGVAGLVGRGVLALAPFLSLAWMFVAL